LARWRGRASPGPMAQRYGVVLWCASWEAQAGSRLVGAPTSVHARRRVRGPAAASVELPRSPSGHSHTRSTGNSAAGLGELAENHHRDHPQHTHPETSQLSGSQERGPLRPRGSPTPTADKRLHRSGRERAGQSDGLAIRRCSDHLCRADRVPLRRNGTRCQSDSDFRRDCGGPDPPVAGRRSGRPFGRHGRRRDVRPTVCVPIRAPRPESSEPVGRSHALTALTLERRLERVGTTSVREGFRRIGGQTAHVRLANWAPSPGKRRGNRWVRPILRHAPSVSPLFLRGRAAHRVRGLVRPRRSEGSLGPVSAADPTGLGPVPWRGAG
jgi:hypothetical protein